MILTEFESAIESILFVSGDPVKVSCIAAAIGQDIKTTREIASGLMAKYKQENRGINIIEIDDMYQMCTAPENFRFVQNLYQEQELGRSRSLLTQPLIETLAIIAYKQPITKSQIEDIRGVSADHAVNKLVERELVCEVGRLDVPGRPILFGTTDEFLRNFGFSSLTQLPEMNTNITESDVLSGS